MSFWRSVSTDVAVSLPNGCWVFMPAQVANSRPWSTDGVRIDAGCGIVRDSTGRNRYDRRPVLGFRSKMVRKPLGSIAALCVLLPACAAPAAQNGKPAREGPPNVVLIVSDDHA